MCLEDGWQYLGRDDKVRGPRTLVEIRGLLQRGQLSGETEVYHDQMGWRFLGHLLLGASYKHPGGAHCRARGPVGSAQGSAELQAPWPSRCSPAIANPRAPTIGAGGAAEDEIGDAAALGTAAAGRPLKTSSATATIGADDEGDAQQLPPQPLAPHAGDDTGAGGSAVVGLQPRQGIGQAVVRTRGVIPAQRSVPGRIKSSRQKHIGDDGPTKPSGSAGSCRNGATMTVTEGGNAALAAVAEAATAAAGTAQVGAVNHGGLPQGRIFFDADLGPRSTAQDFLIPGDSDDDEKMKAALGAAPGTQRGQRMSPPGCESLGGMAFPSQGLFSSSESGTIGTIAEAAMTAEKQYALLGVLRPAADRPIVKRQQQLEEADASQGSPPQQRQRRQLSADPLMESANATRQPPSVPSALPNTVAKKARIMMPGQNAAAAGASDNNKLNNRQTIHASLPAKRANAEEERAIKRRKVAVVEMAEGMQPPVEAAVGSGDGTVVGVVEDFKSANPSGVTSGADGGEQAVVATATLASRQRCRVLQHQLVGSRNGGPGRKATDVVGTGSAWAGVLSMNVGGAVAEKRDKDVTVRPAAAVLASDSGFKSFGEQTHGSRPVEGAVCGVAPQVRRDKTQQAMQAPCHGTASLSAGGHIAVSAVQRSQPNVIAPAGTDTDAAADSNNDASKASAAAIGQRVQGGNPNKAPVAVPAESGNGSAASSGNGNSTLWRSLALTSAAAEGQDKAAVRAAAIESARRARQALRPPNFASLLGRNIPPVAKATEPATPATTQAPGLFDLWKNLTDAERKVLEATCLEYDLVVHWEFGYRIGNQEQHVTILELKDRIDRGELPGHLPVTSMETGDGTIAKAVLAEHAEALAFLEESLRTSKPMRRRPKALNDIILEEAQLTSTWGHEESQPDSTWDGAEDGAGIQGGGGQRGEGKVIVIPSSQPPAKALDGTQCNGSILSVPEDLPSTWADWTAEPSHQPPSAAHQAKVGVNHGFGVAASASSVARQAGAAGRRLSNDIVGGGGGGGGTLDPRLCDHMGTPMPPYRQANTGYAPLSQARHRRGAMRQCNGAVGTVVSAGGSGFADPAAATATVRTALNSVSLWGMQEQQNHLQQQQCPPSELAGQSLQGYGNKVIVPLQPAGGPDSFQLHDFREARGRPDDLHLEPHRCRETVDARRHDNYHCDHRNDVFSYSGHMLPPHHHSPSHGRHGEHPLPSSPGPTRTRGLNGFVVWNMVIEPPPLPPPRSRGLVVPEQEQGRAPGERECEESWGQAAVKLPTIPSLSLPAAKVFLPMQNIVPPGLYSEKNGGSQQLHNQPQQPQPGLLSVQPDAMGQMPVASGGERASRPGVLQEQPQQPQHMQDALPLHLRRFELPRSQAVQQQTRPAGQVTAAAAPSAALVAAAAGAGTSSATAFQAAPMAAFTKVKMEAEAETSRLGFTTPPAHPPLVPSAYQQNTTTTNNSHITVDMSGGEAEIRRLKQLLQELEQRVAADTSFGSAASTAATAAAPPPGTGTGRVLQPPPPQQQAQRNALNERQAPLQDKDTATAVATVAVMTTTAANPAIAANRNTAGEVPIEHPPHQDQTRQEQLNQQLPPVGANNPQQVLTTPRCAVFTSAAAAVSTAAGPSQRPTEGISQGAIGVPAGTAGTAVKHEQEVGNALLGPELKGAVYATSASAVTARQSSTAFISASAPAVSLGPPKQPFEALSCLNTVRFRVLPLSNFFCEPYFPSMCDEDLGLQRNADREAMARRAYEVDDDPEVLMLLSDTDDDEDDVGKGDGGAEEVHRGPDFAGGSASKDCLDAGGGIMEINKEAVTVLMQLLNH